MNAEADRLAGGFCQAFSPKHRYHVRWNHIRWHVLDWALELGAKFYQDNAKPNQDLQAAPAAAKRRKAAFRETDPW